MPTYDSTRFDPPAPLAAVVLRNPDTGATLSGVPMLMDSGADVSLVPQAAVDRLGIAVNSDIQYELTGFNGVASVAPVAHMELVFCRRTFRGQFLLVDQAWGILGRNVLNAIPLLLNGPQLTWEEQRSAS